MTKINDGGPAFPNITPDMCIQGGHGIHTAPGWWRDQFGADHSFIARTQDALAHLLEAPHDQN